MIIYPILLCLIGVKSLQRFAIKEISQNATNAFATTCN